jgi:hypothetical protein
MDQNSGKFDSIDSKGLSASTHPNMKMQKSIYLEKRYDKSKMPKFVIGRVTEIGYSNRPTDLD